MWTGKSLDALIQERTTGSQGLLRAGEITFLREEHSSWCPAPNLSPKDMHASHIIETEHFVVGILKYIYTHNNNNNHNN